MVSSPLPASVHLAAYLFLLLSVLFHELGHLSACTYFKCPHGEIRLGLYLVFPVFYANVSPAWRLKRRERAVVDLAGMYFQIILTLPMALLFLHTRDRLWILLVLQLDAMVLFSLNPFLRFDGYWLCSDLLGVPNLRSRSHLLLRALCRRLLRRSTEATPPLLEIRTGPRLGLALYAVGTYLFGGLVAVLLWRLLPARMQALPVEAGKLLENVVEDWSRGDVAGILNRMLQLLFLVALSIGAGRMIAQVIPVAAGTVRALLRRWRRIRSRQAPQG